MNAVRYAVALISLTLTLAVPVYFKVQNTKLRELTVLESEAEYLLACAGIRGYIDEGWLNRAESVSTYGTGYKVIFVLSEKNITVNSEGEPMGNIYGSLYFEDMEEKVADNGSYVLPEAAILSAAITNQKGITVRRHSVWIR